MNSRETTRIAAQQASQLATISGSGSHIGQPLPRAGIGHLLSGGGRYVDDIVLPGMLHAAFLRSPYAHARFELRSLKAAASEAGVAAVCGYKDFQAICTGWVGTLTNATGMRSAEQFPLPRGLASWQGEAVAMVVAESRAQAEDAVGLIEVDWEELPAVADPAAALDPKTPPIHPGLGGNICWTRDFSTPDFTHEFASAAVVIDRVFTSGRQTCVSLEPRGIVADFEAGRRQLTVYQSHQAPHMMRSIFSSVFGIPDSDIRVITPDVGGSFGLKVHSYPDELACVAASILLRRPVKFVADRGEAFISDIHAREHKIRTRLGLTSDGEIVGFDVEVLSPIGPYSVHPRTSVMEGNMIANVVGAPYRHRHHRLHLDVVFQNKVPTSQYRSVGHPVACAVTETLLDEAARLLGVDPFRLREMNVIRDDEYPYKAASELRFEALSHQASLRKMRELMQYDALREEQKREFGKGRHWGIGVSVLAELSNSGGGVYAGGGAPISPQDGATVRLEPSGRFTCSVSIGEQGQGSEQIYAQVAATVLGVDPTEIRMLTGDTLATPFGGGAAGSRGAGIGGEAVFQAAWALRQQIAEMAGLLHQAEPSRVSLAKAHVLIDGNPTMSLQELARIGYFAPQTLPRHFQAELMASRHYSQRDYPTIYTNAVQASLVEIDVETGLVRLLRHWAVDDCGRVINPLLVKGQLWGGIVQGIGSVLFEECLYDTEGQLLNGTLADYFLPTADFMPEFKVAHVETLTRTSAIGAKGVGEAGTGGAPAAVLCAINDALVRAGGNIILQTPVTPELVLKALGRLQAAG